MKKIPAAEDFDGKIIDAHAHVGVAIKEYANQEYPYAETVESLYYKQRFCDVDINVVFPFTPHLHFDLNAIAKGSYDKAADPVSTAPYQVENQLMLSEVYEFCPELSNRFLPFVCIDPGRAVSEQCDNLEKLLERYCIYGVKISGVLCRSRVTELLQKNRQFLNLFRKHELPLLFHASVDPREEFSHAEQLFRVIDACPDLRICLAHCVGFHKKYLQRIAATPNVWFDTSALKIQVQCAKENSPIAAQGEDAFDTDYTDHCRVLQDLCQAFPEKVIWGTDSPAYTYICRRVQAEGVVHQFRLKGRYEDEKAALDSLSPQMKNQIANRNTRAWLFG